MIDLKIINMKRYKCVKNGDFYKNGDTIHEDEYDNLIDIEKALFTDRYLETPSASTPHKREKPSWVAIPTLDDDYLLNT